MRTKSIIILIVTSLLLGIISLPLYAETITFWGTSEFDEGNLPYYYIPEFEELNPDVEINYKFIAPEQILNQLVTAIAAGTPPDLIDIDNPFLVKFASQGLLTNLTDKIKESDIIDKENYLEAPLKSNMYNDEIYGLPMGSDTLALFYNSEMFKKAGLDPYNPPQTWTELKEAAKKLTNKDEGVYGIGFSANIPIHANWQLGPFIYQNGGSFSNIDSPEAIEALEYIVDFVEKGYTPKGIINMGQAALTGSFLSERFGMIIMGNWEIPRIHSEAEFLWRVAPLPFKEGVGSRASFLGGHNIAIPANSEHVDTAFKFIEYWQKKSNWERTWDLEGRLPSVKGIIPKNPRYIHAYLVFNEQMKYTIPRGPHPNWSEIDDVINKAIQGAIMGDSTSEEALKEASQKIEPLIEGYPIP